MYPKIDIFDLSIPTYILCYGFGAVVSIALLCNLLVQKNCLRKYKNILMLSLLGLYFGARLFGIMSRLFSIYQNTGKWNIAESVKSGIVYFGGLLGYLLTLQCFCKIKRYQTNLINDIIAVVIPLFHGFGRIGCYFGGCCYGKIIDSPISIPYRILSEDESWQYRIPTQLLEALFEFVIFIVLYKQYCKNKEKTLTSQNLLMRYLFTYSVWRFVIEFFRGDILRGIYYGYSFSQYICILIWLYLCVIKYISIRRMKIV